MKMPVAARAPHPSHRYAVGPFPLPAALRLQGEGLRTYSFRSHTLWMM